MRIVVTSRTHLRALNKAVQPSHGVGPLQGINVVLDAQHGRGVDGRTVEDRAVDLALLHLQISWVDRFGWPVRWFVSVLARVSFLKCDSPTERMRATHRADKAGFGSCYIFCLFC